MIIPATDKEMTTNNDGTLFNWYDLGLYSDLINSNFPEYDLDFTVNQLTVTITRGKTTGNNSYSIITPPQTLFFNQNVYIELDSAISLEADDTITFYAYLSKDMKFPTDYATIFSSDSSTTDKISVAFNSAWEWTVNGGTLTIAGVDIVTGDTVNFDAGIKEFVFTVTQTSTTLKNIGCNASNAALYLGSIWDFDVNGEHLYKLDDNDNDISDSTGAVNGTLIGDDPQWIDNPLYSLNGYDSYQVDFSYVPLMVSINDAHMVVGQDGLYPFVVEVDDWKYAVTIVTASDGDHVVLGLEDRTQ